MEQEIPSEAKVYNKVHLKQNRKKKMPVFSWRVVVGSNTRRPVWW